MNSEEILLQGGVVVCENDFSDQEQVLQEISNQKQTFAFKKRKRLTRQRSMCGTPGDMAWERRRRQTQRRRNSIHDCNDEDLHELRGCIELGFGFNEEDGQKLCNTLPALDLYFAVNRNLSLSPVSSPTPTHTPHRLSHSHASSTIASPTGSMVDSDSWKICSPGDDPALIKTKLRHWAQAVACSVMQSH
ncbi:uncharacterized protein LOC131612869 [Vicia villosa]|uniref:uncharacterized protein LOC131612869 n=1 Tax=Vicia villosa TaxID=3911 RepID=UPI00273AA9CC|nr:uncharacterized protein LOC131612869 [Vicia villosa]